MGFLSKVFSSGFGDVVEKISDVADGFHLSGEEKQRFKLEMEALLQKRDSEIEQTLRSKLQAKEKVIVAELQQGDAYTKRARPTVVYAGLVFIFINYTIVPVLSRMFGTDIPITPLKLPTEFWVGWSGIVATWSIGRTMEKRGASSPLSRAVTGSQRSSLLDDDSAKG